MEDAMRRSSHGGIPVKEEKRVGDCSSNLKGDNSRQEVTKKLNLDKSSSPEHKDSSLNKQVTVASNKERSTMEQDSKASSSGQKDQEDPLETARAEMGEVRQENQRLKMYLNQIMKDYQSLQMQFQSVIQQEESKKSTETVDDHQSAEELELVSLSLGSRFSSEPRKDNAKNGTKTSSQGKDNDHEQVKEGLSLGLDSKFEGSKSDGNEHLPNKNPSPVDSFDEPKEEAEQTWPPSKVLKTMRSGDDEVQPQNPAKKARVSVRVRCDTPTMNDGCQWRKYGQKIAKGNPCPRAYYRCTVAPSCPVRKQVQRCAEDMSILITTYEGTHNHPLPISATAMASTTSAAASMLLSGSSSTSQNGLNPSASTATSYLHGLNYYLADNSKSKPLYMYNSSVLSAAPSHPTVTLDLTSSASSSAHFNRFPSNYPNFASTSTLNFSSSEYNASPWGNGFYGSTSQPYNKNQFGTLNLGNNFYQSLLQKSNPTPPPPDTIAAATKAITTDPSFKSALAAALTSIIGSGNGNVVGVSGVGGANMDTGDSNFGQKPKWGEHFPVASNAFASNPNVVNACGTSYTNKTTPSTNSQQGKLMFLPSSLPVSSPRSASTSPGDNKDRIN